MWPHQALRSGDLPGFCLVVSHSRSPLQPGGLVSEGSAPPILPLTNQVPGGSGFSKSGQLRLEFSQRTFFSLSLHAPKLHGCRGNFSFLSACKRSLFPFASCGNRGLLDSSPAPEPSEPALELPPGCQASCWPKEDAEGGPGLLPASRAEPRSVAAVREAWGTQAQQPQAALMKVCQYAVPGEFRTQPAHFPLALQRPLGLE